mmetsp:Transcript_32492/g.93532  ORF Transcript_32492/g.93532 Transcript_32492/m.93532 type:complete len:254 (+) Transcript_32492:3060-3821(+)
MAQLVVCKPCMPFKQRLYPSVAPHICDLQQDHRHQRQQADDQAERQQCPVQVPLQSLLQHSWPQQPRCRGSSSGQEGRQGDLLQPAARQDRQLKEDRVHPALVSPLSCLQELCHHGQARSRQRKEGTYGGRGLDVSTSVFPYGQEYRASVVGLPVGRTDSQAFCAAREDLAVAELEDVALDHHVVGDLPPGIVAEHTDTEGAWRHCLVVRQGLAHARAADAGAPDGGAAGVEALQALADLGYGPQLLCAWQAE